MAFLGRVTWIIARLTFTLFVRLLLRLVLPIVSVLLGWLLSLVTTAFVATVNGPGQYSERLASEWTRQLLDLGVSRDHLDQTYILCRFLAASRIVLGWVVAALFTMVILRSIFGFFI